MNLRRLHVLGLTLGLTTLLALELAVTATLRLGRWVTPRSMLA